MKVADISVYQTVLVSGVGTPDRTFTLLVLLKIGIVNMPYLPKDLKIRNIESSDHSEVISVLKDWWGGRDLTSMLPMLFFRHFCNTSFAIENPESELVAFMIAFLSQSRKNEGYIHFVGVHPEYRGRGIAGYLYNRFFQICRQNNRSVVRACTSPVNRDSIRFHTKTGFQIEPGNGAEADIPVTQNYNRPGDAKVLFVKSI